MTFGNYDPISGASVTATTTISYSCSGVGAGGDTVTITANGGLNGTVDARNMKLSGGSDLLPYTLSLNASHSPIFGDGTNGTQTYSLLYNKTDGTVIVTIYGIINAAIPGGAGDVHAGSYSDTVTITMTF
jgi:spore coat protein U-like protein